MKIEFHNGSIWQVVGSDNYNALVGSPPVGLVLSEWSLADPAAWAYLSPILRENGGWAVFIYTPRGRNHGLSTYRVAEQNSNWFHQILDATQTDVFTPEELAEELRDKIAEYGPDLGQAYFDQEFMCSFDAAVLGAIYSAYMRRAERAGRIGVVPYDPAYPVKTAWDLGFGDSTACWFWQECPGPELRIIDFLHNSGQGPVYYAEQMWGRKYVEGKGFTGESIPGTEHRHAYKYGRHYMPHDAAHKTLAANGRSFGDQMAGFGINADVVSATNQMDQITVGRKALEYAWFDKGRCAYGIAALESYHYAWDEKLKVLKDSPVHDWSSHPSDAWEIIGQAFKAPVIVKPASKPIFLHEATADDIFWPQDSSGAATRKLERL
jgi:phage terminase large subunit